MTCCGKRCLARHLPLPGATGSPPEERLPRPLAKEVGTASVAMPGESAIRVADELAGSVVEVADDVAAPRRDVVDDLPPVFITSDVGGRIRRGLGLQLMNQVCHRGRNCWLRPRAGGAAGRQCRRHDHEQPGLHRYETLERTGPALTGHERPPDTGGTAV